jgi:carboxymethylenebutenolidase
VTDSATALEEVGRLPGVERGTGIVGFCCGGALGFNVVDLAADGTAPSIYHFALADSYMEPETVELIEKAVTVRPNVRFETYEGPDHALDHPDFPLHDPQASALAWKRTVAFLAEHLPPG